MASQNLSSQMSGTQMTEFVTCAGRAGISLERAKRLMGDDALFERFVEAGLLAVPEFRLIHGVFNKQDDVLASFKSRCEEKGIDFGKFSWVTPEHAPDFDPSDPETVVVLNATLGTLQETFEFAWAWTVDGQEANWRWTGMVSDSKKLRLLSDDREEDAEGDSPDFTPWTLSWRRIKLDTDIGKRPVDVRNPVTSPGCALLFMSAEHPERIKAIDYKKRFGFWLSGLKCSAPDEQALQRVPGVGLSVGGHEVYLDASACVHSYDDLSSPSFRE